MRLFLPILLGIASSALAAPDIQIQGRQSGIWNQIDDGDLVPNQAVTDFGTVDFGSSDDRLYRIRNRGDEDLQVTSISSGHGDFTIVGITLPVTIPENDDRQFTIRSSPFILNVTGYGDDNDGGAEIVVRGPTGAEITAGSIDPNPVNGTDFGSVKPVNEVERTFLVQNIGDEPLIFGVGITSAGSGFAAFSSESEVAPGGSAPFVVRFKPSQVGPHSTSISVSNNDLDGNERPFHFAVAGTGDTISPDIAVFGLDDLEIFNGDANAREANGTVFDSSAVGTSESTRTFTISNSGQADLLIAAVASSHPDFQINGFPSEIPAGGSGLLSVSFAPSSPGLLESVLSIASNDSTASPYIFAIAGVAIDISPRDDFAVTDFALVGETDVRISFRSSVGKTYRVVESTGLADWKPVDGHTGIEGTGEVVTRTLVGLGMAAGPARQLRVEEE